jgi:hypothetical protein
MTLPPFLTAIIGWLRAGYPEGVPQRDYIPLLALLPSRLTDDDVAAIADRLARASDPPSTEAIRAAIGATVQTQPLDSDVARVSARLTAGGWPPAGSRRTWPTGDRRGGLHRVE